MEVFTHDGLTFEVTDTGPDGGRVVLALHGFPEDRHCWAALTGPLVAAGCRVLAPDQRGYSPGARPAGRRPYRLERLVADVLALARAAGPGPVDLVGHDWGAAVAWAVAARHPEAVRSLTALSVPHPGAMRRAALRGQALHSWYMAAVQIPALPEALLARGEGRPFAAALVADGLDRASAERYAARAARRELTGPLNWYRALPFGGLAPLPAVRVPTLYVWGTEDRYITVAAARAGAGFVAAPYRFVALDGASHWLPSAAAAELAPLLLDHMGSVAP